MKAHTDLQILNAIFRRHKKDYLCWKQSQPNRGSKIYVPVDIEAIAYSLGIEVDIVWGRLYYDLDNRYAYQNGKGAWTHLFSPKVGDDDNCIHFPYLVSVIASLRAQAWKTWLPVGISGVALLVAALSLAWNVSSHSEPEAGGNSSADHSSQHPNQWQHGDRFRRASAPNRQVCQALGFKETGS